MKSVWLNVFFIVVHFFFLILTKRLKAKENITTLLSDVLNIIIINKIT